VRVVSRAAHETAASYEYEVLVILYEVESILHSRLLPVLKRYVFKKPGHNFKLTRWQIPTGQARVQSVHHVCMYV